MQTYSKKCAFSALPIIKTKQHLNIWFKTHFLIIFKRIQNTSVTFCDLKMPRINHTSLTTLIFHLSLGHPTSAFWGPWGGRTLICGGRYLGSVGSIRMKHKARWCYGEPERSEDLHGCFHTLTMQPCLLSSALAKSGHSGLVKSGCGSLVCVFSMWRGSMERK